MKTVIEFRLLLMRVVMANHRADDLERRSGILDSRTMAARSEASDLTEELVEVYKKARGGG